MDWKAIAKLGLKILASTVAGVVIFMGIDKAVKNENQPKPKPEIKTGEEVKPVDNKDVVNNEDNKVVNGLKGAVSSFGKLYILTQSITNLAENIARLFGRQEYTQPYNNDPWFSGGNYGTGYNNGWSRVNPYIIQATPSPNGPIFNANNYPF